MRLVVAAVVPAAGSGVRLAADDAAGGPAPPKALRLLAGVSLVRRAVSVLEPHVDSIVVVAPAEELGRLRAELCGVAVPIEVVQGGATRQESVRLGLGAVPRDADVVLVHDAARPLVPSSVVSRVVDAVTAGAAAVVPCVAVTDSLRVEDAGGTRPIDRGAVRAVQTPQGFQAAVLRQAHAAAGSGDFPGGATDDASLVERAGTPVHVVAGDRLAFKITSSVDLLLAEELVRRGIAGTSESGSPGEPVVQR